MLRIGSILLMLSLSLVLSGCGGGGGSSSSISSSPSRPATVGVLITDASSEDFDEAIARVRSVELLCENGRQSVFRGRATFDLLKLTDTVELLTIKDGIRADTCTKVRLEIDRLRLNTLDEDGEVDESIDAKIVANGKIDLSPRGSFEIEGGETIFISLDFDIPKSLKITETGNGMFIVRPVIFVDIDSIPGFKNGLTRISGVIDELAEDYSAMRVCLVEFLSEPDSEPGVNDDPDICVPVIVEQDTGIFGEDGMPIPVELLMVGDEVVIVGLLEVKDDGLTPMLAAMVRDDSDDDDGTITPPITLTAIVIERGPAGTFLQIAGRLKSAVDPKNGNYFLEAAPGQGYDDKPTIAGMLFPESRVIDPEGMDIDRITLKPEDILLADGVFLPEGSPDGDLLQTSLMIVKVSDEPAPGEDLLVGKIQTIDDGTLIVTTSETDRCVNAQETLVLFIVEVEGSLEVIKGTVDDLIPDITIVAFGEEDELGACFNADVITTEGPPKAPQG